MYFYYDMNGRPYGLQYNGNIYYYLLNAQGDVIRMLDSTGATVASYEYDPFGNIISATGAMAEANPLRYRGYYYDRETGFYYLNSRYYDPKIGRFINADSYVSTGQGIVGYNMFAYCGNNPVNASDPMGDFWLWDLLDVHFAAESWTEFVFDPSLEGLGYALLDTLGAMPLVPSYSTIDNGVDIAKGGVKAVKGASKLDIPNAKFDIDKGKDLFRNAHFKKPDIKMVNDAARQVGVDRIEFGNFIHEIKKELQMKANQNFTYQELLELAEEFKEMMK